MGISMVELNCMRKINIIHLKRRIDQCRDIVIDIEINRGCARGLHRVCLAAS